MLDDDALRTRRAALGPSRIQARLSLLWTVHAEPTWLFGAALSSAGRVAWRAEATLGHERCDVTVDPNQSRPALGHELTSAPTSAGSALAASQLLASTPDVIEALLPMEHQIRLSRTSNPSDHARQWTSPRCSFGDFGQ